MAHALMSLEVSPVIVILALKSLLLCKYAWILMSVPWNQDCAEVANV